MYIIISCVYIYNRCILYVSTVYTLIDFHCNVDTTCVYVCVYVYVSQDSQTIEHEQAESGALYATPQKKKGKKEKKKKDQAEANVEEGAAVAALYSIPDKKGKKEKSAGVSGFTCNTLDTPHIIIICSYIYYTVRSHK